MIGHSLIIKGMTYPSLMLLKMAEALRSPVRGAKIPHTLEIEKDEGVESYKAQVKNTRPYVGGLPIDTPAPKGNNNEVSPYLTKAWNKFPGWVTGTGIR